MMKYWIFKSAVLIFTALLASCSSSVNVEKGVLNSSLVTEPTIQVSFVVSHQNVLESAALLSVDLQLSSSRQTPTPISIAISGSATEGEDFHFLSARPFLFPAGVTQAQLQILIQEDQLVESSELIRLTLSSQQRGVTIGTPSAHNITIIDNDGPPQVVHFNLPSSNQPSMPETVIVTFSKLMDSSFVEDAANWSYACTGGGAGSIASVSLMSNVATVNLVTSVQPAEGHSCSLVASTTLRDLEGQQLAGDLQVRQVFYTLFAPPVVTAVTSSSSNGWYKVGDLINVQIVFDEAVIVSGAQPQLTLETGAVDAIVSLGSGSGTNTLSGTFEVQSDYATSDLNYVATSSLVLNGATILGTANNFAANLTLPALAGGFSLAGQKTIGVDTQNPTIPSGLVDGVYSNSTTQSPVVTFVSGVDGQSGVSHHEAQVVSASNQIIKDWATLVSGDVISGLSLLPNTQYFVNLRTVDLAGNVSSSVTSDGWLVDITPPPQMGAISLGAVPQSSSLSPAISWSAVTDLGPSGISHYQVQLWQGSSAIGSWVNREIGQTLTSLSLVTGTSYFVKVRAIDVAGNVGADMSSDPWVALADTSDICLTTNPAIGTLCDDGSIYAGIVTVGGQSYKIATTPSNCADHPDGGPSVGPTADFTASCSGSGEDSLQKILFRPTLNYNGDYDSYTNLDLLGINYTVKSLIPGDISSQQVLSITPTNPPFAYCDKMNFAGKTDWYLPNKTEMTFLYCKAQTSATGVASYPDEDPNCATYLYGTNEHKLLGFGTNWRSYSTSTFSSSYWDTVQVFFQGDASNGQSSIGLEGNANGNFVRCIRRIATVPP